MAEKSSSTSEHSSEGEVPELEEFIDYGEPIKVTAISESGAPTTIVLTD